MRPPRTLALVVVRHAAFLAAVDLDVGGIQVNRDRPFGQRCCPRRGQQRHHPPGDRCQSRLHRQPLHAGDPAGHARSRRRRQARYRGDLLAGRVRAVAVQPGQEILPGQLRCCQPRQQLPGPEPAITLLNRADRGIQFADYAQPVTQPGDRSHPRVRGQRPVRRADAHLTALPLPAAYPCHQIGVLSAETIITSQ
jgi:hypothetical protein